MVNANALKKPTTAKGEPPKRGQGVDPIKANTRPDTAPKRGLQLKVSQEIFDDFSRLARETCGETKGAKAEFFLEIFDHWKRSHQKG